MRIQISVSWLIKSCTSLLLISNSFAAIAQTNTSYSANAIPINGLRSVGIGFTSLQNNQASTPNNTAVGFAALNANTTGTRNVAIGNEALRFNTTGIYNTALGSFALRSNTTGNSNAAMGFEALRNNTTGSANAALGAFSMRSNTTGANNTAVGNNSLFSNVIGIRNTAIGAFALQKSTGSYNTTVGAFAFASTTAANFNTVVGFDGGYLTIQDHGSLNTLLGANAMEPLAEYENGMEMNTIAGFRSGYASRGSRNVFLGNQSGLGQFESDKFSLASMSSLIEGDFLTGKLIMGHTETYVLAWPGNRTLYVQRGILTDSLRVMHVGQWADMVFEDDYDLMKPSELKEYIQRYKKLPEMPSANEVAAEGFSLGQMQSLLLKKVEELTLYLIDSEKKNQQISVPQVDKKLEKEMEKIKEKLKDLQ
jgi:trimeric autotransporter adhesin